MKQQWNTAFRWSLGALAVMGASLALAQAQPVPEPPPDVSSEPCPAVVLRITGQLGTTRTAQ